MKQFKDVIAGMFDIFSDLQPYTKDTYFCYNNTKGATSTARSAECGKFKVVAYAAGPGYAVMVLEKAKNKLSGMSVIFDDNPPAKKESKRYSVQPRNISWQEAVERINMLIDNPGFEVDIDNDKFIEVTEYMESLYGESLGEINLKTYKILYDGKDYSWNRRDTAVLTRGKLTGEQTVQILPLKTGGYKARFIETDRHNDKQVVNKRIGAFADFYRIMKRRQARDEEDKQTALQFEYTVTKDIPEELLEELTILDTIRQIK